MESVFFSDVVYIFIGVPITFFSWLMAGFFIIYSQNKRSVILNRNLAQIQKKWSFDKDEIVDLQSDESSNPYRPFLILGFALCLFSWLGFLFSWVAWGSLIFVKSRHEKRMMNSELATHPQLSVERVSELMEAFSRN